MELRILQPNEDRTAAIFSGEDCRQLLDIYEDYYPKVGFYPPWVGYLVMRDGVVVGTCGFTGKPSGGAVELAYWTFSEYEGQGVASYACRALIEIAKSTDPPVKVTAKTAPEHNVSTKILEKNGFLFSKVVTDEEIGDAWLWTL